MDVLVCVCLFAWTGVLNVRVEHMGLMCVCCVIMCMCVCVCVYVCVCVAVCLHVCRNDKHVSP